MLRDITLGQYYQTESVIHRLDPRVKLVATVCYIISLFIVDNLLGYLVAYIKASVAASSVAFFAYTVTLCILFFFCLIFRCRNCEITVF